MESADIHRHIVENFPGTHVMEGFGDLFYIHDPNRDLPDERLQPWATLVHSDVHDQASDLNRDGVFRLNIGLPRGDFTALFPVAAEHDLTALDVLMPHPVYGGQGWVCVLNPVTAWPAARDLLAVAHGFAVRKFENAAQRSASRANPA